MRITLDIDRVVLEEVERLRDKDGRSLGRVVSDLLTWALAKRREQQAETTELRWAVQKMGARIDLTDKETLYRVLDEGTDQ